MLINIEIRGYMTDEDLTKTLDLIKQRILDLNYHKDVVTDHSELLDLGGADFKGRLDINLQDFEEDKGDPYLRDLIYEELEDAYLFNDEDVRGTLLKGPIDNLIGIIKELFLERETQEIVEIIDEKIEENFRKCEHCGKPILEGIHYTTADEYFCNDVCLENQYKDVYPGLLQTMYDDKILVAQEWGIEIS